MKTSQTSLTDLVVEYHRLYAKYRRPEYLGMAAKLDKCTPDRFGEIWEARVNAGCERNGLPKIY